MRPCWRSPRRSSAAATAAPLREQRPATEQTLSELRRSGWRGKSWPGVKHCTRAGTRTEACAFAMRTPKRVVSGIGPLGGLLCS